MPSKMPSNFTVSVNPKIILNKQGIEFGKYKNLTLNDIGINNLPLMANTTKNS